PRIAAAPTHPGPGPGEYLPGEQRRLGTTPRRHTDVRRLLLGLVLRDLPAADHLPRRLHHSPHEAALEAAALGGAVGAAATGSDARLRQPHVGGGGEPVARVRR